MNPIVKKKTLAANVVNALFLRPMYRPAWPSPEEFWWFPNGGVQVTDSDGTVYQLTAPANGLGYLGWREVPVEKIQAEFRWMREQELRYREKTSQA